GLLVLDGGHQEEHVSGARGEDAAAVSLGDAQRAPSGVTTVGALFQVTAGEVGVGELVQGFVDGFLEPFVQSRVGAEEVFGDRELGHGSLSGSGGEERKGRVLGRAGGDSIGISVGRRAGERTTGTGLGQYGRFWPTMGRWRGTQASGE